MGKIPPVLFIFYKRHKIIKKTFPMILASKPEKIYLFQDSPKSERDKEKCSLSRSLIENIMRRVSWKCKIKKYYSKRHLGCGLGPSTAISWLFKHEKEGIIVEEDALITKSFALFASEMLKKYRKDKKIMMISGINSLENWKSGIQSYHLSKYGSLCPAWATWRRAWKMFRYEIHEEDIGELEKIRAWLKNDKYFFYLLKSLKKAKNGKTEAWDFQWHFSRHENHGFSIVPSKNLVRLLGYDSDATHTKNPFSTLSMLRAYSLHPPFIPPVFPYSEEFDRKAYKKQRSIFNRMGNKIAHLLLKYGN